MLDIREIPLGPHMTKYHFQQPGIPAMHHMRSADPDGEFHDPPFAMISFVLFGGYVEEVLSPVGATRFRQHERGDRFLIPAKHIHRIVELPEGECWTITLPLEFEQEWSLYQQRNDGIYKRFHNQDEWTRYEAA